MTTIRRNNEKMSKLVTVLGQFRIITIPAQKNIIKDFQRQNLSTAEEFSLENLMKKYKAEVTEKIHLVENQ